MYLLSPQTTAWCQACGKCLIGTFGAQRQSLRDPCPNGPERMIPGPHSLSEGQKADGRRPLISEGPACRMGSNIFCMAPEADQGRISRVHCEINFCSM